MLPIAWGSASAAENDSTQRRSILEKIIKYFDNTNKPKEAKKFDVSMLCGPHYSSDSGVGLGIVAGALYRTDPSDSITQPSNISFKGDITTKQHYKAGIEGYHIFALDRHRLDYDLQFESIKTKFWGIGYDMDCNGDNESTYKYILLSADADYLCHIGRSVFVGPLASIEYLNGRHFSNPDLLMGEDSVTFNLGVGLTLRYDTRDFLPNPSTGVYICIDQRFNPRFIGNKYAFSLTEITASWYKSVWKGGIIAPRFHARFTYGNTPWGLLSTLGDSHTMRGYFEGRYRDKCSTDICVELRQHIWRRSGAVMWIGAGTVFPKFSQLRWNRVLPNAGVGYRWEFKHRINVRLDVGFGKNGYGVIFNIKEAF